MIVVRVCNACHVQEAAGCVLGAWRSPHFGSKRCSSCGEGGACTQRGFPCRSHEGIGPTGPSAGAGSRVLMSWGLLCLLLLPRLLSPLFRPLVPCQRV